MARVLVLYGTHDGQTALIAHRIADHLRGNGHQTDVRDARALPSSFSPRVFDAVVVGASVRWGLHPHSIREFVLTHAAILGGRPCWFYSVSLQPARGPRGLQVAAERVSRFCAETGFTPERAQVFAGALLYSAYGPVLRQLVRLSAWVEGLPTDASRDWDFTDWAAVRSFARELDRRIAPVDESAERGEQRPLSAAALAEAPAHAADDEGERAAKARAAVASSEHTTIPDAQYPGEEQDESESEAPTQSSAPLPH